MKTTINFNDFERAFQDYNRQDNFTYEGLKALFNWLEEYEADSDTEIELDVIALCCDFTEYSDLAEFQANYGSDDYPDLESVQDATLLIEVWHSDGFIIQNF